MTQNIEETIDPRTENNNAELHPESKGEDDIVETEEFKRNMWAGQANIMVAVRLRPLLAHDRDQVQTVKVLDNKIVVVMDPGNEKDIVGKLRKRNREKRYAFDHVFAPSDGQVTVYQHTTKFLIHGVLNGFNATVFAYGCTGAGKTYTMLGTPDNPGIMALTLEDLFQNIEGAHTTDSCITYKVHVSFVEIYNENIRDLLTSGSSEYLDLREDPQKGPTVTGIKEVEAKNADHVMSLLRRGNKNRTQEATAANEVSSRSHAVLQVIVEHGEKTPGTVSAVKHGKLSMIDLAGSERAAKTKNRGQRLLEGANINRSLLALGNCINALGEKSSKFVPYRDSKLTRLLKDSLGGNCRTVMITNISMAVSAFEETLNTLKYANRAKNIKTTVSRNVLKVNYHITEYVSLIDALKSEIHVLKHQLVTQDTSTTPRATPESKDNSNREAREKILRIFRDRMKFRRNLVDLENQNVRSSVEIGKHQLMVKEYERQKEQDESANDSPEEQASQAGHDDLEQLQQSIDDSISIIKKLKKSISSNGDRKQELTSQLRENEVEMEKIKSELESTVSSEELKDLMRMEYRIGKLELHNMELEQARMVHDSIVQGKDLTIQQLQMELQTRNKIIKQQQDILEKNNLDGAMKYGILNSLEEATLSEGFDTLRMSMNRITTPPIVGEGNRSAYQQPSTDSQPRPHPPAPPLQLENKAKMSPKQKENRRNNDPYAKFKRPTRNNQKEWTEQTALPYIRFRKKAPSACQYLTVIKTKKKKSTKLPKLTDSTKEDLGDA